MKKKKKLTVHSPIFTIHNPLKIIKILSYYLQYQYYQFYPFSFSCKKKKGTFRKYPKKLVILRKSSWFYSKQIKLYYIIRKRSLTPTISLIHQWRKDLTPKFITSIQPSKVGQTFSIDTTNFKFHKRVVNHISNYW